MSQLDSQHTVCLKRCPIQRRDRTCLLHRLCNPAKMWAAERRNALNEETAGAELEYLVYGKFGTKESDKGFWDTKWCALGELLEHAQVDGEEVKDAVEAWQEAEEAAREGLFALAAPAEE